MSGTGDTTRRAVVLIGLVAVLAAVLIASTDQNVAGSKPKASLATLRAEAWPETAEWYGDFTHEDLRGDLAYEEGVIRRDPSSVLLIDGLHHVWYTKSVGDWPGFGTGDPDAKVFPWDLSEVWWATSPDGRTWTEQGLAVGRGPAGAFDDRSVFTPEVLAHGGRYYLVYQQIQAPYRLRTKNTVGMAIADSPGGPWRKLPKPILRPTDDGKWLGDQDDRHEVAQQGSFDSHKVHDPCLLPFNGRFFLYYKGEQIGERVSFGGRDIRWGVAIAESIEGPYRKSPLNPITNSGHEVCVWPYQGGVSALLTTDGPERNTIQHAADGLNFSVRAVLRRTPSALGLVRTLDTESHPLAGLEWGLCHEYRGRWQHIRRFSCKPRERY